MHWNSEKQGDTMLCQHCGVQMRLINQARSRLLLYWCPTCQRFAEVVRRSGPRGAAWDASPVTGVTA